MPYPAGAFDAAQTNGGASHGKHVSNRTSIAVIATSAAERGNWEEAHRAAADMNYRTERLLRLLASTRNEMSGKGEIRALNLRARQVAVL